MGKQEQQVFWGLQWLCTTKWASVSGQSLWRSTRELSIDDTCSLPAWHTRAKATGDSIVRGVCAYESITVSGTLGLLQWKNRTSSSLIRWTDRPSQPDGMGQRHHTSWLTKMLGLSLRRLASSCKLANASRDSFMLIQQQHPSCGSATCVRIGKIQMPFLQLFNSA